MFILVRRGRIILWARRQTRIQFQAGLVFVAAKTTIVLVQTMFIYTFGKGVSCIIPTVVLVYALVKGFVVLVTFGGGLCLALLPT
jgi:hypothetical protein